MKLSIPILFLTSCLFPPALHADHPTVSLDNGSPGPITTISATTLPQGFVSSAVQGQFIFSDEISDGDLQRYSLLDEHIHSIDSVVSTSLNTAYGVSDTLTLGISLPYLRRNGLRDASSHHDEGDHDDEGRVHKHGDHEEKHEIEEGAEVDPVVHSHDLEGLADATLYGQFQFFRDEKTRRHAAVIGGLKMPTGRTGLRDEEGELFDVHHQPGSGSWDPIAGMAFTQQWGAWSFDMNGLYTFVTDGTNDTNLGDIFNYNFALSYRLLGFEGECSHEGHNHSSPQNILPELSIHRHGPIWDLILEANGDWRNKVVEDGVVDPHTGGNLIFLSAGSRVAFTNGWTGTISTGIPVVNDLNGVQSEPKLRLLLGISKSF
jgi:hypothetical protein